MKKIVFAFVFILNLSAMGAFAQKAPKSKMVNGVVMTADRDIIQNISRSADYSTLLSAITTAGLTETFKSKGPITIFAPTNEAFAQMPADELDTLMKHKYELSSLITYHAIAGRVSIKDITRNIKEHKGIAAYITLAGSKIYASIDANRNVVLTDENGGQSIISKFDVAQKNGMLHVVTEVIVPKKRVI